jgi:hypothetical protein
VYLTRSFHGSGGCQPAASHGGRQVQSQETLYEILNGTRGWNGYFLQLLLISFANRRSALAINEHQCVTVRNNQLYARHSLHCTTHFRSCPCIFRFTVSFIIFIVAENFNIYSNLIWIACLKAATAFYTIIVRLNEYLLEIWTREYLLTTLLYDVTAQWIIHVSLRRSIKSWTTTAQNIYWSIIVFTNRNMAKLFDSACLTSKPEVGLLYKHVPLPAHR